VKKVLLDTNVVLDVLLERKLHFSAATRVWAAVERRRIEGFLSAHAITTIYYVVQKEQGAVAALRCVNALLKTFSVASVDEAVLSEATRSPLPDFEDAVTAAAARASGCSLIVTRDPRGFHGGPLRCLPPEAALPLLGL
jgi:predicted nucleic acid-binding protein